jgi:hypothetical protein
MLQLGIHVFSDTKQSENFKGRDNLENLRSDGGIQSCYTDEPLISIKIWDV